MSFLLLSSPFSTFTSQTRIFILNTSDGSSIKISSNAAIGSQTAALNKLG